MKDLTQGSVTKHILNLSAFIAITMVFQTMYFIVDLYFVSQLGKDAIAGVAVGGNLMMLVLALTQMLGVGTTALIAMAAGRKDQSTAQKVFNQSFVFSIVVGVFVLIAGVLLRNAYATLMSADAGTAHEAERYLTTFIPALALQFAFISMASALRGTGIVKPTSAVQILTVVINILLAPVLIAGKLTHRPLGTFGAGLATLIAMAIGVVALTFYFRKLETYVSFDKSQWKPDFKIWKQMVNIGLPAGGEFALMSVYIGVVYVIIRNFGAAAQAGFGIGGRIMQALFVPVISIAFAASPVAGQNFGAKFGGRVRQSFISAAWMSSLMMVVITIICRWSPGTLIGIFSKEPGVIAFGSDYLRIISLNFVAMAVIFSSSAIFQAVGNTWPSLASSASRLVFFALPAFWLSTRPGFTLQQVWWLSVATVAIQAIINVLLLNRELGRKLRFDGVPAAAVPSVEATAAG